MTHFDLEDSPPIGIRRAIAGIVGIQVAIGAALLMIDLVGAVPKADPLTRHIPAGPSTRPYSPNRSPMTRPDGGTMPERLEITGTGAEITLTGQIAVGDGLRISRDITTRDGVERVAMDSTGGSVSDALEIGETLRLARIDTVLNDGAVCLSACPYMFAGGVERSVADTASLGVHQHYFGESAILPAFMAVEDVQRGQAEVMAHLSKMGIGLGVMEHAMRTPPEQIYLLSREELTEYNFVTD